MNSVIFYISVYQVIDIVSSHSLVCGHRGRNHFMPIMKIKFVFSLALYEARLTHHSACHLMTFEPFYPMCPQHSRGVEFPK